MTVDKIKEGLKIKAWKVEDLDRYEGGCTVVFAETRGKAKIVAQGTSACEDAEFTRIRCCRMPDADHLYHGEPEMDWYADDDRIFLVKEHGWYCLDGYTDVCETCPAREWCSEREIERG